MCVSGFALGAFLLALPVYLNEFVNNSERAFVFAVYTLGFATGRLGRKANYRQCYHEFVKWGRAQVGTQSNSI